MSAIWNVGAQCSVSTKVRWVELGRADFSPELIDERLERDLLARG